MMKKLLLISLIAGFISSCNQNQGTTSLIIRLTDSPGDYEEVNIDIQSVEIHVKESEGTNGWHELPVHSGIFNLLELTNGAEAIIANDQFPIGQISQLRLILGDSNSVMIDGVTHKLTIPSGSESGLKLQIHANLEEGITYSILLDFDAARSVVKSGNSEKYLLKPVIKAITEAQDGAIKGKVLPTTLNIAAYAIEGSDTVSTTYATTGVSNFVLGGLQSGTYSISLDPGELSGYKGLTIENISVSTGKVTDVGTVELIQ